MARQITLHKKGMVKMTDREEIFLYLKGAIQEELDRLRNDFEFGEICKEEFEELTDEVEQTYIDCLESMALADDAEIMEEMSNVLGYDFKDNTESKIKGI